MNVFEIATIVINSSKDEEFNIHSMLTFVLKEAEDDRDAAYALAVVVDQLLKAADVAEEDEGVQMGQMTLSYT
tara:strand:- start:749 stop:967 length:219 start_codon:yes stop_codon:yes gene_type:complete